MKNTHHTVISQFNMQPWSMIKGSIIACENHSYDREPDTGSREDCNY